MNNSNKLYAHSIEDAHKKEDFIEFLHQLDLKLPSFPIITQRSALVINYARYKSIFPENWHNVNVLSLFIKGNYVFRQSRYGIMIMGIPLTIHYKYALALMIYSEINGDLRLVERAGFEPAC